MLKKCLGIFQNAKYMIVERAKFKLSYAYDKSNNVSNKTIFVLNQGNLGPIVLSIL